MRHECADPTAAFRALFDRPTPPKRGGIRLSCEEGLIIRLAKLATDAHGRKPFNRWLAPSAAAGMLASETYRRVAHAAIIDSAKIALASMRRHRYNTDHGHVTG